MVRHKLAHCPVYHFAIFANLAGQRPLLLFQGFPLETMPFFGLGQNAAGSGMCVLEVWATVSLQAYRFLGIINYIATSAVFEKGVFDRPQLHHSVLLASGLFVSLGCSIQHVDCPQNVTLAATHFGSALKFYYSVS